MKIPIVERFLSLQGEAQSPGRLAYFLRFPDCTLNCAYCDTKYASRAKKWDEIDLDDIIETIKAIEEKLKRKPLIVFTGGEPLMKKSLICSIINLLEGYIIQIETNGTLMPIQDSAQDILNEKYGVHITYNVSPKLLSSKNKPEVAIKIPVLKKFLEKQAIFKFVIKDQKDWSQMEEIISVVQIPKDRVYIMPEGVDGEKWRQKALELFDMIVQSGYNMSPRLQITLFGKKKMI